MTTELEIAAEKDFPIVLELLARLYAELGEEKESLDFLAPELLGFMLASGKTEIYLARYQDKIVGMLSLTESQAIYAGGKYGVIDEMYVEPAYRAKEVGKKMITHIFAIARQRQWKRIDVTAPTEERWKRTVKFYEANGFVYTGPKFKLKLK